MRNAVLKGNKQEINLILRSLKDQNGSPNFPAVLSIPSTDRLPALAQKDFEGTLDLVVAGVAMAMKAMNLKRPMTGEQMNDLAEEIVETSREDNLGLEDLLLFMQGLVRGKYGELYESMDIPKFMEKFEVYRQERHEALLKFRENKHLEYKSLGDPNRKKSDDPLDIHLSDMSTKIQQLKDELKEQKDVNKRLREDF